MRAELLGCGHTGEGQLGVRLSESTIQVPERIIGAPNDMDGTAVTSVTCGEQHTVFLTKDGKMWSVGSNMDGQLGRGSRTEGSFSIYPVSWTSSAKIIQISAGRSHTVSVTDDGRVFAWGSNEHGQLGMESKFTWQGTPRRVQEINDIVQVASGSNHCIALDEGGRVFVWGEQADGRCIHRPEPVEQLSGVPIVRVLAGARHCLALSASGAVFTWGQNNSGELGIDDLRPQTSVQHVHQMDGLGVVEAACGDNHTVLLTHCGRTFSFGSDALGQCGFGKKVEKRTNPTAVSDLIGSHVTRIAAGACHTIAICKGAPYPFGLNSSGQLGNGKIMTQSTPRKTDELDHVTGVFAGYHQTFFVRSSGTIEQNEIVGPSCPMQYPIKLDHESLKKLLDEGDALEVMSLIESVFSSLASMNMSFLYKDERRYNVGFCFERSHGIDMDQVMEAFMLFDEYPMKRQYMELIVDSLKIAFQEWSENLKGIECLRVLLMLPWLPIFTENVNVQTIKNVHTPFVDAMCLITGDLRAALEKWWTQLSTRHFRRMVTVFKTAIKAMLKAKKGPRDCHKFILIMQKLSLINKTYHIIPLETFYIDELNTSVDLKLEYVLELTRQDPNKTELDYWTHFPFLLNGVAKGELIFVEAWLMQTLRRQSSLFNTAHGTIIFELPHLELTVRREFIVSDTMNQMAGLSESDLQKPLKVNIAGEDADDAGGVRKEFFILVMRKILQSDYGMFSEDEESHLVWFSGLPSEFCDREQFHQLGRLVGLSIYNHSIVPFPFPLALYKYLLDTPPDLEDLCELSPSEGKGLKMLLSYEEDDVEDVFGLNFCISFNILGETHTTELLSGGTEKPVTNANRDEYVRLYVHHRLELGYNGEIAQQALLFRKGFSESLHSRTLRFFQPCELKEMIVGNENYDWNEFRDILMYRGEYSSSHPTIQAFWKAFFALTDDERRKFLQFLTGSTRIPVSGWEELHAAIQPSAPESLPVAHTCFNLLDLPNIADDVELLRRLRISIEHTEGFTLA
ncbi:HECT domain-containing protein [Caenorhabditis elegans]|uniref:HECT domain-containing protein n=5 Tax=Caenorhabditis elegans TaxID=6239 RepID=Q9BL11_CAEEL|nr:HECT domain-containing protein [Caenorhabditis elegans]CCD73459.1 HECT domain-containing protein [Caenorhabditis elegans]|eukprot:NP_490834.1 HECT and RCC domain E3 ubiquitin ligase [Caenorhabditis elegans]